MNMDMMDLMEYDAAAEATLIGGIVSVLYFVYIGLVATFALLLAFVLVPIVIVWSIFLDLPMWLQMICVYLILRRMLVARQP